MMHRIAAPLLAKLPVPIVRTIIQKQHARIHDDGSHQRQLLIDISEVIQHDARTGIQRVVRGILLPLFAEQPAGFRVRPVFADRNRGYRYAPVSVTCLQADVSQRVTAPEVVVKPGDIFLGLDLAAHVLPRHQGQLLRWKRSGARICIVVYDLLPILYPQWFKPVRQKTFCRWLRTLAIYADDLICISKTVQGDLFHQLTSRYGMLDGLPRLHTIPLGADLESTMPSSGCTAGEREMFRQVQKREFVLMVGTLEPRKGYADVLDAFEQLWHGGQQTTLVIVGKPGWRTEALQERIRLHPEQYNRLYWFEHASDELLQELYKAAQGVLLASEAEGFGLPLVEALRYGKPVLVRDIPVYREVGKTIVTYFNANEFVVCLHRWLQADSSIQVQQNIRQQICWQESVHYLSAIMINE